MFAHAFPLDTSVTVLPQKSRLGVSASHAQRQEISLSYLEQLFVKLRKGHIVKSVRGPGGGYVLGKHPSKISVGEVISVVEEPLNPVACLDAGSGCDRAERCITQKVWKGLAEKIAEFLNSVTIEDLSHEVKLHDTASTAGADACEIS